MDAKKLVMAVVFYHGPDNAEIMRIDGTGMTYKGRRIEDGGEAHRAFMGVMNMMLNPAQQD